MEGAMDITRIIDSLNEQMTLFPEMPEQEKSMLLSGVYSITGNGENAKALTTDREVRAEMLRKSATLSKDQQTNECRTRALKTTFALIDEANISRRSVWETDTGVEVLTEGSMALYRGELRELSTLLEDGLVEP